MNNSKAMSTICTRSNNKRRRTISLHDKSPCVDSSYKKNCTTDTYISDKINHTNGETLEDIKKTLNLDKINFPFLKNGEKLDQILNAKRQRRNSYS